MDEELRNMLAEYIRNQAMGSAGADVGNFGGNFGPQPGPEGPNLPQMGLQSRVAGAPAVSGGYSLPVAGGDVSVRGNFHKPNPQDPANWGASVGYHKQF